MRFALVLTVLMSAAAGPRALLAQTVGDRVHVTTIAGETVTGEVVGAGPGGLDIDFKTGWFGWYGGRRSISHAEIEQLGRSVGVRRQWRRGLVTGGLVGVVTGLLAGDVLRDTCDLTTLGRASDECAEVGGGLGLRMAGVYGATGGVAGLGLGSLFKEDLWETIPIRGADMAPIPAIDMLLGTGDRVRVIIAGERMTGEVARMGPEGFEVDIEGFGLASVTESEIEQLQRSIGVRSRWKRGLVIGGVVGLAIGTAIGDAREADRNDGGIFDPEEWAAEVQGGLPAGGTFDPGGRAADEEGGLPVEGIWAAVGVAAGLGVGLMLKQDLWETIVWEAAPDRGADMTFHPVINMRLGPGGRPAAVLAGRIRF